MIAGIDFSTHAIDIVLLDEDTSAATWHRFPLAGQDAFDRARKVREALHGTSGLWDETLACGIEEPRGYGAGSLYRIQGAILSCLPHGLLVQPFIPSEWRAAVGLKGNATKDQVYAHAALMRVPDGELWAQDAMDAYCIARATERLLEFNAGLSAELG